MKKISVIGLSGASVFLSVDHFHAKGETVTASSLFEEAGGKGFNQAVAVKRLGVETAFLSAVGRDGGGKLCGDTLEKEKITAVLPEKDEKTAYAAILTDKNGENKVTVFRGAQLDENDVRAFEEHIADSDLLLLQLEVPAPVNMKAAEIAKKHDVPYVLNPAPITEYTKEIRYLCENALFITPNEAEAKIIFKNKTDDPDEMTEKYVQSNIKRAVVTLGDKGALILMNGKSIPVPAQKVSAVDTTGAGDVFNGAFCVKLIEDITLCDDEEKIKEYAKYAAKAAAYSVGRKHVLDSIPTKDFDKIPEGQKMEKSKYIVKKIKSKAEIDSVPKAYIDKYVWGGEYRPQAYAQLGFIENKGLYFKLTCFESDPKAVYKNYNDQVWLDSCLEFFISPCNDDKRYLNIEMNSAGAYLCGLRYSRENKVDIATVAEPPKVTAKRYADRWTVEGLLSLETVEKVFGRFDKKFKGNLYKCGDETAIPHFGMWSPVGTEKPDFHRPEYFGDFEIED